MDSETKMIQILVEQWQSPSTTKTMVTWVDMNEKLVKVGDAITFKDEEHPGNWLVKEIFSTTEKKKSELHTDWNVGGLTGKH